MHHPVKTAAGMLGLKQRDLFALLRRLGMVNARNEPMRIYVDQGMLFERVSDWTHPVTQQVRYYRRTMITDRGVEWLRRYLQEQNNESSNERASSQGKSAAAYGSYRPADRRDAEPR